MHLRRRFSGLHRGSALFVFCVLLMRAAHADSSECAYTIGLQLVTVASSDRDRTVTVYSAEQCTGSNSSGRPNALLFADCSLQAAPPHMQRAMLGRAHEVVIRSQQGQLMSHA